MFVKPTNTNCTETLLHLFNFFTRLGGDKYKTCFRMSKTIRSVIFVFIYFLFSYHIHGQPFLTNPNQLRDLQFSDLVEVRDVQGSRMLSSQEARTELNSFLADKPVDDVKLLHKGYSKDETSYYGIIQIRSDTNRYRVFYYCELINGDYKVTKLRMNQR